MKNYQLFRRLGNYIIVISAFAAIAISCNEEFLEEDLYEYLGPSNTFTNTSGFEAALIGLYDWQRAELFDPKNNAGEAYGVFQSGTDVVQTATAMPVHLFLEQLGSTIQPADFSSFWDWGYVIVGNANQIISSLDNPGIKWDNPTDRNRIEAEARFFRAYAYRTMMYTYGDLPIVTELTKPFRNDYTRAPIADIQKLIIDDLMFAETNLPETTSKDGKLVKAAAQHYLAEMYLYTGKPDLAETEAKKVTGSPNYQLMTTRFGKYLSEPGDVFSDLFKTGNANRSQGNKEGIWVQQWEYNVIGGVYGGGWETPWDRRDIVPFYSAIAGFQLADTLGGRGIGRLRPLEWWYIDAYETQDVRNSNYNIKRKWYYNNKANPNLYGKECPITQDLRVAGRLYESSTKFNFGVTAVNPSYLLSCKDKYLIRLADTWLLLAEAQMKQGKLTDAAASINVVRNRAKATPATPAKVTMDYILDERARELFGEEARRFTLIRTGTFMDRVKRLNPKAGPNFQPHNVLLPIPQTAIDANTGAVLQQNPGF